MYRSSSDLDPITGLPLRCTPGRRRISAKLNLPTGFDVETGFLATAQVILSIPVASLLRLGMGILISVKHYYLLILFFH